MRMLVSLPLGRPASRRFWSTQLLERVEPHVAAADDGDDRSGAGRGRVGRAGQHRRGRGGAARLGDNLGVLEDPQHRVDNRRVLDRDDGVDVMLDMGER